MVNKKIFFRFLKKYYREVTVFIFFIVFFLRIVKTVFSYTIIDYEFYKQKAIKQQSFTKEIKAIRGDINAQYA
jgi:cell division protein FtsI/penicillin-binding protein 2